MPGYGTSDTIAEYMDEVRELRPKAAAWDKVVALAEEMMRWSGDREKFGIEVLEIVRASREG